MDNQIGKANLEVFSETLLQEAKLNNKIVNIVNIFSLEFID